jgi:hypothetical protein
MTVFEGFGKKPSKNTLEKVPFLLVRFLPKAFGTKKTNQDHLFKRKVK